MPTFRLSNANYGNEKNICFVNSILQIMACIPVIKEFFENKNYKTCDSRMYQLCSEISRLFGFTGSRQIQSAGALRTTLGSMPGQSFVKDGKQQDAVMFMNSLLTKIEQEVGCAGPHPLSGHKDNCVVSLIQGREIFENKFVISNDGSCPMCGTMPRSTEQKFEIFHLYNRHHKAISIQELLDENFVTPSEKFTLICSGCNYGQPQEIRALRSITKLPPVLLLNVPKFEVPTKSLPSDEFITINNEKYRLCGVLDHIGLDQHGGHWITWARCSQAAGGWLLCDDSSIEPVTLDRVLNKNNYIFAYHKYFENIPASQAPVVRSPQASSPVGENTWTAVPVHKRRKSSKITSLGDKCAACGKSFSRLMQHLKMKSVCQIPYDMEALEKELKAKQEEQTKERKRKSRAQRTPDKVKNDKEKDQAAHQKARDLSNPEKAKEDREKNKLAHQEARLLRTPKKADEDRDKDRLAHQNKRKDLSPETKEAILEKDREAHQKSRVLRTPKKADEDREKKKLANQEARDLRTPKKADEDREKDKLAHQEARVLRTPSEAEEDRVKNRLAHQNKRKNLSPETKEKILEKDREGHKRLRTEQKKDPLYKQNVAAMKAKYREKVFKKINKTVIGRYRIFLETIRDGPVFPCVSCHRLLYNNSVIEIKSLQEFKEALDDIDETLFEKTIDAPGEIPSFRDRYFLCQTCKGYIYKNKMPPMCHNNKLEIFCNKSVPQLQLTELEGSCIAKNLLFMKIHDLPRSGMKGIIDKTVMIPIDEDTINQTITSFPRTPTEASLVPFKWKRMKEFKNDHLKQYVNIRKLIDALQFIKKSGHKEYQFNFETSVENYLERCKEQFVKTDPDDNDNSSSSSSDDSNSSASYNLRNDPDSDVEFSRESADSSEETDKFEKSPELKEASDEETAELEKLPKLVKLKDKVKEELDDEAEYLKLDPAGRFQFNYNRVTGLSNNYPEIYVRDQPHTIAPGEGKRPKSMLMDDEWDLKSHPYLDPTGENNLNAEREVPLRNVQYIEQRIKNVNPAYAKTISILFAFLNYIDMKQLTSRINMSVMRGTKRVVDGMTSYGLDDAFQVFDNITGTPRYWQKKKMELQAMVENVGPFTMFFTLSAADTRYPENFTALLQDHQISYVYREGREECLIDGETIEKFLETNSSKFAFIRDNILTATRNYYFRVRSFIRTIVMNNFSEMCCKFYSYRVEFQLRGSAHIHGVLFLDLDKIVDNEMRKGIKEWEFLQSALNKCRNNEIPSEDEEIAIILFVDKFISCSLFHPRSRKIASEVQRHHHTFSCRKAGSKCRFHFPRFPSLWTFLAKPLRIIFKNEEDDTRRKAQVMKIRLALTNVRSVLEDQEEMSEIEQIYSEELEEIVQQRDLVQRYENILDDDIFREQILRINKDHEGVIKDKLGKLLIENLHSLHQEHKDTLKKLEAKEHGYFRARLLEVLKKANLYTILEIDENLSEDEKDTKLLQEYHEILKYSTKGYSVVLKRDISEIFINNYNQEWLPAWNSNMDISPVFCFFSVLVYVSDYFMKSDEKILQKLVDAVKQTGDMTLRKKLTMMRDVFLTHRSMGECEMFYRLIPSMHLADSNLGTVFIHTGLKKSKFLRKVEDGDESKNAVSIENRDGLYIETSSITDKYLKRPASMRNLTLIQFAKRYTAFSKIKEDEFYSDAEKDDLETELETSEDNFENSIHQDFIIARDPSKRKPLEKVMALEGSFYTNEPRFMKLRKQPLVIRIHKFKMDTHTHDFCYSQLELYYIFRDEDERKKCEEDVTFCFQIYMENQDDINYVKRKAMPFMNDVEDAMETAQEIVNNDIGEELDPENVQDNEDAQEEGFREPDSFVAFDYDKEPQDTLPPAQLFKRIEVNEFEILGQKTRELDNDQLFVVNKVIDYAKSYQRCRITDEPVPEPMLLKILGTAGTGKSHVINIVAQWVEHYLRREGDNIDCPYVIKCSFTGSASSQIDGQTLHKAFSLAFGDKREEGKYRSLGDKTRDKLTTALRNLRLVIVDEYSMIKVDYIYQMDLRLREIKQNQQQFGGCCVLFFGDPMQLRPVLGRFAWELPVGAQFQMAHELQSVWSNFKPVLLRQNHRQNEDLKFSEVLNRIRVGQFTQEDINYLKPRVVLRNDPKIPLDRMYIFARNKEVNFMNEDILRKMPGEEFVVEAEVHHKTNSEFEAKVMNTGYIVNTSLMKTLKFKINSKVILTYNINVVDGLCNGTFCKIVGIKQNQQGKLFEIHVQFLNPSNGLETSKEHPDLAAKYGFPVVPIKRMEQRLNIGGKTLGSVLQFAVKLSDSVTSHRVQGQTIRDPTAVVVDLKHCKDPGQVYVTLSRAQKLSQLYILENLYTDNWNASVQCLNELDDSEENALNASNKNENTFEIVSMNIRSLRKHYQDILRYFEFHPSDMICLQETWMIPGEDPAKYQVGDMIPYFNAVGQGKGLATYLSSPFKLAQHYCLEDCQLTKVSSDKLDVINVYRSAKCMVFENELQSIINVKRPTIVCGDTNINVGPDPGKCSSSLVHLMASLGFTQLVSGSTHDKGGSIDQVFVNLNLRKNITIKKTRVTFSDHDQIRVIVKDL